MITESHFTEASDLDRCSSTLSSGGWSSQNSILNNPRNPQVWQPPGCMLHDFTAKEINTCTKTSKLVYIGDSTVRQLYWATVRKLDSRHADRGQTTARKHSNLLFADSQGTVVEFFWDPFLNSTTLSRELSPKKRPADSDTQKASFVILGGGLWHAKYLGAAYDEHFNKSLQGLTEFIGLPRSRHSNKFDTLSPSPTEKNIRVMLPVQKPLYERLSPERAQNMTHTRIDRLNDQLKSISVERGLPVAWAFSSMIEDQPTQYAEDGLHVTEFTADKMVRILLNLRCSSEDYTTKLFPLDGTCCRHYPRGHLLRQFLLFSSPLLLVCFLVMKSFICSAWSSEHPHIRTHDPNAHFLYPYPTIRALGIVIAAVLYSQMTDRTQIWDKLHKRGSLPDFLALCGLSLLPAAVLVRKTGSRSLSSSKVATAIFLSREQTDEWKGWMQFIILAYHYTGVSRVLWVYKLIRLLVGSYLFMTGFGHTVFFYRKADYSLRRSFSVLLRLNLLSYLLPYAMDTTYDFYYFAPLISFWYLVVYGTMAVWHSKNKSTTFLLAKFSIAAMLTICIIHWPWFLNLFWLLARIAKIHWNVEEWDFRLGLDAYIVYVGAICGILYVKYQEWESSSSEGKMQHVRLMIKILSAVSILGTIMLYVPVYLRTHKKEDYNRHHPYLSILPITTYVLFRNCSSSIRSKYSSVFAWLGRISLETFTLQFHIWMAADTKGVLSTGLNRSFSSSKGPYSLHQRLIGDWVDFTIVTVLFLWISWRVAGATQVIVDFVDKLSSDLDKPKSSRRTLLKIILGLLLFFWLLNVINA